MFRLATFIISITIYHATFALDFTNIVFVIMDRNDTYSAKQAEETKQLLRSQIIPTIVDGADEEDISIIDSSKYKKDTEHDWIYVRALKYLLREFGTSSRKWAIFLEARTYVNYTLLLDVLNAQQPSDPKFIGHVDSQAHGNDVGRDVGYFLYPYLSSGFAVQIDEIPLRLKSKSSYVVSEPGLILAKRFLMQHKSKRLYFKPNPYFCGRIFDSRRCATYPSHFKPCGNAIANDSIFYAVSTVKQHHKTRVVTIKKTWGKEVSLAFFSDITDPKIPTISTNVAMRRNEKEQYMEDQGVCRKIKTILAMAASYATKNKQIKWIFLANDDIVISVFRLRQLLSCYDHDAEVVVGRVYQVVHENNANIESFDYVTLGAGAVFSVPAAELISQCPCTQPDEQFIGQCAIEQEIALIHSPLFYEEPIESYRNREPIEFKPLSFKEDVNPEKTYYKLKRGWFHPIYMPYFESRYHVNLNKPT